MEKPRTHNGQKTTGKNFNSVDSTTSNLDSSLIGSRLYLERLLFLRSQTWLNLSPPLQGVAKELDSAMDGVVTDLVKSESLPGTAKS